MNYGQLDLFNFKSVDKKTEHILDVREKCPDDIAIVWTATELGNNSDPHYFLNVEDAKKLCSDQRSKGVLHGTKWAFFWSSLKNYCGNYYDLTDGGLDMSKFYDNGSRDWLLDELQIKKITLD